MCVLVTGGAGFIGSHTVERLLAQGMHVRVLDDFSTGRLDNLPHHPRLEILTGDIRDRALVEDAMHRATRVLHLAAQVSVAASVEAPLASASINVTGFLNVLEAARRHRVRRLVYASSAAVYGVPARLPIDEDAPTAPISPYGLEKEINDRYAALYRSLYGLPTLGLRYFNVYGPRQDPSSPYSGVISIFCRRLREARPLSVFGDGLQTRDFIYVGDVARANAAALEGDLTGVCNVATGESISLRTLIKALSAVSGTRPLVSYREPRAGDIRESAADNRRLVTALKVSEFEPLGDGLSRLWASVA
ncbi:MAG: NAD-dependent epimerase/dehydratase family protein [Rhodocyclaceae bacterium]